MVPSRTYQVSSRSLCTWSGAADPTGKVISNTTVVMSGAHRCSTTSRSRNHQACVCSLAGLSMTACIAYLISSVAESSSAPVTIRFPYIDSVKYPYTHVCLLYTSDAADDLTRVDLGGRR